MIRVNIAMKTLWQTWLETKELFGQKQLNNVYDSLNCSSFI